MANGFLDTLSTGLSAFGQGRSFADVDQERKDKRLMILQRQLGIDDARTNALFKDALVANSLLESNPMQASEFIGQRANLISQIGGDPSDTLEIKNLIDSGQITQAQELLGATVRAGRESGILPQLPSAQKPFKSSEQIERELKVSEGALDLRREELRQRQIESGKIKLSSKAEKAIIDSQDAFFKSGESARKMELLANDFERLNVGGGLASTVSESLKDILGSQDEVTQARKRFNAIRSSQATSNLPPGPASDKDIALALSGFPKENANASQVIGFLKGQAKLARIDEKFNEFKAGFISNNNSVKGLIPAWKNQLQQEGFLDDILSPQDQIKDIQQPSTIGRFQVEVQ